MQRILAITLMLLFGLPVISPLFALGGDAETNLPACCRRNGMHHCMMGMNMGSTSTGASAATGAAGGAGARTTAAIVTERCPYGAQSMPVAVHEGWTLDTAAAVFAGLVSHPAGSPQTESKRRVASLRARQKRGPPVLSL
jgi:hypothetical protein